MIIRLTSFLILIVCGISAVGREQVFKAVRTGMVPVMDGKLTDKCWTKAVPTSNFRIMNSTGKVQYKTEARVLYNDTGLYFGIKCLRKNMATMPAKKRARDKQVYHDECVEIMLDPNRDKKTYYHFIVNAVGSIFDRVCDQGGFVGDKKWNGEIKTAVYRGPDFWSCEIFVPFYTLEITPAVNSQWRFNIGREAKNPEELSAISEDGSFNIAGRFATLSGLDVDFSKYCWTLEKPVCKTKIKAGKLELKLTSAIQNKTGKKSAVKAECILVSPREQVYISSVNANIPNKTQQQLAMGDFTLKEKGKYKYYISLNNSVNKTALVRKSGYLKVDYIPMAIDLQVPWYKNAIFATQKIKNVILNVDLNMPQAELKKLSLDVSVRAKDSKVAIDTKKISAVAASNKIIFNATKLPEGKLEIVAKLLERSGKVKAQTTHLFRKLPYRKGEVWLGQDMQWYADGKKFFMLGGWNRGEDNLKNYNTILLNNRTVIAPENIPEGSHTKTLLSRKNMKILGSLMHIPTKYRMNKFPTKLSPEAEAYLIDQIKKMSKHPQMFAYYTCDEPEVFGVTDAALLALYKLISEHDPYHPVIISNDTLSGLKDYADCADINGLHPYPTVLQGKPMNSFDEVALFVESSVKFFKKRKHKQTIAYLHQGFNYGDCGAINSRIPSYQEYRNQNYLALICGTKGILQYNRTVAHYPETYIGMPALTAELLYTSKALLADDVKGSATPANMKLMVKKLNGEIWIFACNASHTPTNATITVPGLGSRKLQLISENRSVNPKDNSFSDNFGNYQVHIYTTSNKKSGLKTVKAICQQIKQVNRKRRKPGNLAFQEFENNGVKVTASSNRGKNRRDDNGLWHVVDGIFDKIDNYHNLTWSDTTPGKYPDWLEIKLPQVKKVSKVIVYPRKESLKDYEVQAFVNGKWQTVDKVSSKKAKVITHKFSSIKTDRIRLWITGTNGPTAKITEIEIY
jgi:F5/8 type C domain-containing protein/cellulose/xylan binding protein with CBM9 domain